MYFISIALAVVCSLNDEQAKFWYRKELARRQLLHAGNTAKEQLMEKVEVCVELLQKVKEKQKLQEQETFELKREVAQLSHDINGLPKAIVAQEMVRVAGWTQESRDIQRASLQE